MSGAAKPADLMEPGLRRNPGEPSAAQADANSYRKPTVQWRGLTIAIENPAGSVRRGRNRHGVTWEVRMRFDYGEVVGSMGVDGDPVDIYLGPNLDAPMVYVVHQRRVNDWANYDEDKVMAGFDCQADAEAAFLSSYNDARFLGPVTAIPVDEFVAKVRATKDKPAMIKSVLFFKAMVGPYLRGGRLVQGYQGRNSRAVAGPGQMSLFGGPESGKPLPPSPLNGKDAVEHTPDMFAEPDHLLADFPEGTKWSRGNGRIKGHYAVELPGGDVVGNYHENPEHAVAQAKDWLANRASSAKQKADRAAAIGAMRERLAAGGDATDNNLKLLGLKSGSSGLKWFIPAAAEVFGITSHAVRPHIKDMIRVGHTDMGTKLEFVDPRKALAAVAAGLAPKPTIRPHAIETTEFKDWFGDSKVVDTTGKPLVVYHGTADDFSEFKHGHANRKDNGWLGQGFYFTNDPEISNSYTNLKAGASPNVMPVYLSLRNPYQATIRDKERLMLAERRGDKGAAAEWTRELAAKGYDGVILSYGHIQNGDYPAEYVVFEPNQVKSATGNNGKFDPNSADITKSLPVVFIAPT